MFRRGRHDSTSPLAAPPAGWDQDVVAPPARHGRGRANPVPVSPLPARRPPTARDQDPLMGLLQLVVADIERWSHANGYGSVPPAYLLSQLAELVADLGQATGRDPAPER